MKIKKSITSIVFLLLNTVVLNAQENSTSSGGEATGSGGIVSYSVGQVIYTTSIGTNGSVAQGVQQPYEISSTAGVNETSIHLELSVYPNPTTNFLTLKTEGGANLSYQIVDIKGKEIEIKELFSNETIINLGEHPTSTYFISVMKNNIIIKTFKVIKK